MLKQETVSPTWKLVDAAGLPVGRLAAVLANMLRGKDRPDYTPHVRSGPIIVVINADKVKLTGAKETKKIYKRFSGYPSGLKEFTAAEMRRRNPCYILRHAVRGMLPANHTRPILMRHLKVYAGPEHPHAAQQPEPCEIRL
jgi:large subunit ribosomal protein L13